MKYRRLDGFGKLKFEVKNQQTDTADSGPLRMNTIAPRDQFKPIRIGENLVVNYKG